MSVSPRPSPRHGPVHALVLMACAVLAGCGSLDGSGTGLVAGITPYRPEIVQGNFVSREQVQALQPGMSRLQVTEILGTPLLTSLFHADRWDYVFTLRRQGVQPQSYQLVVFFKGDQLDRFEGDTMPSETEFVRRLDPGRKTGKAPQLEASEAELAKYPPPPPAAPTSPEAPLPDSYPPLEPAR